MNTQRLGPSGTPFLALLLLAASLPLSVAAGPGALSPLALALLGQAHASGDSRELQHALLHALAAQHLPPPGDAGLAPVDLGAFLAEPPTAAFALRWRSPSAWLGGSVPALAWSPDGTWLAPYVSEVDAVAMDRNARLLALGVKDKVLGLVDLAAGARPADAAPGAAVHRRAPQGPGHQR